MWIGITQMVSRQGTVTGINLLPWRRMMRERAIKKRRLYCFYGVMTISIIMLLTHYYGKQVNQRQALHHSMEQALDQDVYRKNRKQFQEQFKKNTAKIAEQSLDSLHYIGLLKDGSKTWALISQSNGLVSIILTGDYLGKEHGRVVHIKKDVIEIEKSMWGKQGVVKKWILLPLR